jgi:hypothetical protein
VFPWFEQVPKTSVLAYARGGGGVELIINGLAVKL